MKYLYFLLFLVLFAFVGCNAINSAPSDSELKQILTHSIMERHPLTGNSTDCAVEKIDILDIKEKGQFHKDANYLLVKVRIKATSACRSFVGNRYSRPFDKVFEYKIAKNDYGKWYAEEYR